MIFLELKVSRAMYLATMFVLLHNALLFSSSVATSIRKGCTTGKISELKVHCNSKNSYLVLCSEPTQADVEIRITYTKRVFHINDSIGLPIQILWNLGIHKAVVRIGIANQQYTYTMSARELQITVQNNASIYYIMCDTPIDQCDSSSDEDRQISHDLPHFALDSSLENFEPDSQDFETESICSEDSYGQYKPKHEEARSAVDFFLDDEDYNKIIMPEGSAMDMPNMPDASIIDILYWQEDSVMDMPKIPGFSDVDRINTQEGSTADINVLEGSAMNITNMLDVIAMDMLINMEGSTMEGSAMDMLIKMEGSAMDNEDNDMEDSYTMSSKAYERQWGSVGDNKDDKSLDDSLETISYPTSALATPTLIFPLNETQVTVGEDVQLHCGVKGEYIRCLWQDSNGQDIQIANLTAGTNIHYDHRLKRAVMNTSQDPDQDQCGVIIKNITKEDEGHWICKVFVIGKELIGNLTLFVFDVSNKTSAQVISNSNSQETSSSSSYSKGTPSSSSYSQEVPSSSSYSKDTPSTSSYSQGTPSSSSYSQQTPSSPSYISNSKPQQTPSSSSYFKQTPSTPSDIPNSNSQKSPSSSSYTSLLVLLLGGTIVTLFLVFVLLSIIKCYYRRNKDLVTPSECGTTQEKKAMVV